MPLRYQLGDDALEQTLRLHVGDLDVASGPTLTLGSGGLAIDSSYLQPPAPPKLLGAVLARLGREPALQDGVIDRVAAMRAEVRRALGDRSPGRGPKFLLRVDDYPRWDIPTKEYVPFHAALGGLPYLLAVTPRVAAAPLDPADRDDRVLTPDETALLARLVDDGAEVALHGLTHRTRTRKPHSELSGLGEAATLALVDEGLQLLGRDALAFVPPFNHFGPAEYRALAQRFRIISAGGRESVHAFGSYTSPAWVEGALYVPSYAPAYGRAAELVSFVAGLLERVTEEVLVPITLHWAWERADAFAGVRALAAAVSGRVMSWKAFADASDARLARRAA